MATATNYVINPLELPSDQVAAALFNQTVIVGSAGQWTSSPSWTWPDVSTAARTTCANAALATEQARLQARQDAVNRDISIITATP